MILPSRQSYPKIWGNFDGFSTSWAKSPIFAQNDHELHIVL